jgi:hypothetical protein
VKKEKAVVHSLSKNRSDALPSRSPAGAIAGLAGALAMNLANHRGSPAGHGAQTQKPAGPPHSSDAALDPLEKAVAETVSEDPALLWKVGTAGHYATGAACGLAYSLIQAASRSTLGRSTLARSTLARGAGYGFSVWLLLDQTALPMLGLSKKPSEYPARIHVRTLALHLLFGAVTSGIYEALCGRRRALPESALPK